MTKAPSLLYTSSAQYGKDNDTEPFNKTIPAKVHKHVVLW